MITVQLERVAAVVQELKPLLELNCAEISQYPDIPLDVDWNWYCTSDIVRLFTAREDGPMVGYACFFVGRNRHYMTSLQAVQDVIFVHPQHRGTAGVRLLRFAHEALRAEGAQVVYQHVKKRHPVLGKVLDHMGYEDVETIKALRLDKPASLAKE